MLFGLKSRLHEAALWGGWLALGFVVLALASYSPDDPAWSVSVGEGDFVVVTNHGGYAGAYIADEKRAPTTAFDNLNICLL